MSRNKSTAAQRRFIEALARGVDRTQFAEHFAKAARINGNAGIAGHETPTQAAGRLSKQAASVLIESLKAAGVEPQRVPDPYAKATKPAFLKVREPEPLDPVAGEVDESLAF